MMIILPVRSTEDLEDSSQLGYNKVCCLDWRHSVSQSHMTHVKKICLHCPDIGRLSLENQQHIRVPEHHILASACVAGLGFVMIIEMLLELAGVCRTVAWSSALMCLPPLMDLKIFWGEDWMTQEQLIAQRGIASSLWDICSLTGSFHLPLFVLQPSHC